jgi:hypothetical protein
MHKQQAMSTFKSIDNNNCEKQSHSVVPFYHSELLWSWLIELSYGPVN